MSKFNKGDKVRVTTGTFKGMEATVDKPEWAPSASDWPVVFLIGEDGGNYSTDEENLELVKAVNEDSQIDKLVSDLQAVSKACKEDYALAVGLAMKLYERGVRHEG